MSRIALQLDFDGTVTEEDVSFLLLDTFADKSWRYVLTEYEEGKINVGTFNRQVFGMVRADQQAMLDTVMTSEHVRIRPGFRDLMDFCKTGNIKTIIVSNGLTFYIEALLNSLGIKGIEIHASKNEFNPEGMKVGYMGPDGKEMDEGFKEAYARMLLDKGYEVIYTGDGSSDIYPVRIASVVYATGSLLEKCREEKIDCIPFHDFHVVLNDLKSRMSR